MQMLTEALAPPPGFRKAIPAVTKLEVVLAQGGACTACGQRLGLLEDTEFDHVPALQRRLWDPDAKDTVPPANSKENIEAKHKDCHRSKTTGRKGESKLSVAGGDIQEIAKTKRLAAQEEEFRRRMLAKGTEAKPEPERKTRWPKRPFPKREKQLEPGRARSSKGSRRVDEAVGDQGLPAREEQEA